MGVCGAFTYSSTLGDGLTTLPSLITFTPSTLQFSIDTTQIVSSTTYSIMVTGALNSPGPSSSITFSIVLQGCDLTVISTTTKSDQTFEVNDVINTFSITAFTESYGVCGSFGYVATLSDGISSIPSILSFNSATLMFTITTTSIISTTSYIIRVTGSLTSPGPNSYIQFTVYTIACDSSAITAPTILDQLFSYYQATTSFTMTTFSESLGRCGSFTYTITQSDGTSIPALLTFNSASLTFTVDTSLITTSIVYTIKVKGSLASPGGFASTTFKLTLIACDNAVISTTAIPNQSFEYGDTINTFSMTAFTESMGTCTPFTYVATQSNGLSIPSLLSFDSTTLKFTVTIGSILTTTSYTIKVVGSLASPGGSSFVTFTLSLIACDTTVVSSTAIPNRSYTYNDIANTFAITAFTESYGRCGSFAYTVTQSNGLSIPSLLTFNSATLLFTVDTTAITTTISYTIKVVGALASPGGSSTQTFTLSLKGCDTTTITTTAINDQTFTIGDTTTTFSMIAFTESIGYCGSFTYTVTQSSGSVIPGILSFNSGTLIFTVATSSILTTTSYVIKVTGALSAGVSSSVSFNLNLISCMSTAITTYPIADETFIVDDTTKTFSLTPWIESLGRCTPFTYTITQSNGAAIPSILTFDSTSDVFTVATTSITTTTNYIIEVLGTLNYPSPTPYITFNLYLTACDSTTITTHSITDQTFTINDAANTFTFTDWTESLGRCSPFIYTAKQVDGTAIPGLLNFDSTSRIFTVTTSSILTTTQYSIQVLGTLTNPGSTATITFTLYLISCGSSTILTVPISDYTFTYNDVTTDYTYTDWSESMTVCAPFTYVATQTDGTALPTILSFTGSTRTFSVVTSNILTTVSYSIKVTGTLSYSGPSSYLTFTIYLVACDSTIINSVSIPTQIFTVNDAIDTYTLMQWTESLGVCGPFTYSATQVDGTALPALYSFDSTTQIFTIITADILTSTSYSIKVVATLPSPGPSSYITFTLTLIACDNTVITPVAIPDTSFYYNQVDNTYTITGWSESLGRCTPFTYSAVLSSGATWPSLIAFDTTNGIFTVTTSSIILTTSYTILVTGNLALPGPTSAESFTLTVVGCDSTVITSVTIPDQTFTVNDVTNTFSFIEWTESLNVCTSFTYTATLSDGSALPSYLVFDGTTKTFTVTTASLLITTSFTVKITGSLGYPGPSASTTFVFNQIGCDSTVITPYSIFDETFIYNQAINSVTLTTWTESLGRCLPFTYSALLNDGSSLPSFITIDPTTGTITVDTPSIVLSDIYYIDVTGALASPGPSALESFTLTITGCDSSVISPITILDQGFTVNDVINTFTFPDWTESLGICSPFTYAATLDDGITAIPSFLTLDSPTQTFTVDASALVLTTSYSIMVTGSLAYPGQSSTTIFTLTITACDSTTITSVAIPNTSFNYADVIDTYLITDWSESLGRCTPFIYTATQTDGSALPSMIAFDTITRTFIVSTSSIILSTIYDITVIGTLTLGSVTDSQSFQLTLIGCDSTIITSIPVPDQTFTVNDVINSYTFATWAETMGVCAPFTYTLTQQDGSAIPIYVSLTSATRTLAITTSQILTSNTYAVQIVGSLPYPGPSSIVTFNLQLISCESTVVTTTPIADQTFHIYDNPTANTFSFLTWTESLGRCTPFTYTALQSDGSSIPSLLTFDSTTMTFTVSIVDILVDGIYTIEVTGNTAMSGPAETVSFSLTLISCQNTVITAPSQVDQTFTMGDSTKTTYQILSFSESFGICTSYFGAFTYSALLSDGSSLPSIITFDSTTNIFTVDIFSIQATIDYVIQIMGALPSPYPSASVTVTFHMIGCSSTVITTPTDYLSSYTFIYGDIVQDITISAFTETYAGLCGPFTYNSSAVVASRRRLSTSYPDSLPYFMTFDRTNLIFIIDTNRIYSSNTYDITLRGTLPNGITTFIDLTVNIIGCEPGIVTAPSIATQTYTVGDIRLYIALNGITVTNTLCTYTTIETVTYTKYPITQRADSNSILPECMLQSNYYHDLQIQTSNSSMRGNYYIFVTVEVDFDPVNSLVKKYVTYSFEIIVSASIYAVDYNTGPPYFLAELVPSLTVYEGTNSHYHLPQYQDDQSLIVKTVAIIGGAYWFVSFTNDQFNIKPLHGDRGDYIIGINLTDTDLQTPLTSSYSFILHVLPIDYISSNSTDPDTNSTSNQTTPTPQQNASMTNTQLIYKQYYSEINQTSFSNTIGTIGAWIKKFDMYGNVTVQFSTSQLFVPTKYYFIDEDVLDLYIIDSDGKRRTDFNWTLTNFTRSNLIFKLSFDDPNSVGLSQEGDTLFVKFLLSGYFFEIPSLKYIPQNYLISNKIPPQIDKTSALASSVDYTSTVVKSATIAAASIGMGMSVALPFTNTFVWGILNTLQLILHIPLFTIAFPSQTAEMFSELIQMANFQIFPLEPIILKYTPSFSETDAFNDKFDYLGYGCCDMMINLANTLLGWITLFLTIPLILFFFIVKRCCKRVTPWYVKFRDSLLFNAFIRVIIQTYLLVCIATVTSFEKGQSIVMETTLRCIFMVFMGLVPIMCIVFGIFYDRMSNRIQQMIGSLFDDLDLDCSMARQYYTVFMIRRILFTMVAIYLSDHGEYQVMLYMVLSLFQLTYIIGVWPMDSQKGNLMEIFNESTILVCGYHLFLMTDWIESPEIKWNAGWSIIVVTVFNLVVNIAVSIYDALGQIGDYLAENCSKKSSKRSRKNQIVDYDDSSPSKKGLKSYDHDEHNDQSFNETKSLKSQLKKALKQDDDMVENLDQRQFDTVNSIFINNTALNLISMPTDHSNNYKSYLNKKKEVYRGFRNNDELSNFNSVSSVNNPNTTFEKQNLFNKDYSIQKNVNIPGEVNPKEQIEKNNKKHVPLQNHKPKDNRFQQYQSYDASHDPDQFNF